MSINDIVAAYNAAKEQEKAAKKQSEQLKQTILNYAGGSGYFETETYIVMIEKRRTTRIDTETLYKDFPDFKDTYGKTTFSDIITAKEKQQEKKSA